MGRGKQVLYVRMLGEFSMTWDGRRIPVGFRGGGSHFAHLMQALLHNRETGVRREELIQILFENRDIDDVSHCLRSVIYSAGQKLKKAGLPDVRYFIDRKGTLFWNEEIPVLEDAGRLDQLCLRAGQEQDPDRQLLTYLEACRLYTGEFLPSDTAILWVAQENRRYSRQFRSCVGACARLLRKRGAFRRIRELGMYAAFRQPFEEWELLSVQALLWMGRIRQARELFDRMADRYILKEGLEMTPAMQDMQERLLVWEDDKEDVLPAICRQLDSEQAEGSAGQLSTWPVFKHLYRQARQLALQRKLPASLLLCALDEGNEKGAGTKAKKERLATGLAEAVCSCVQETDPVLECGGDRYLILLTGAGQQDCALLQARIRAHDSCRKMPLIFRSMQLGKEKKT